MSKKIESKPVNSQEEAFEMIELAAEDIDLLAEAFDIISEACLDLNTAEPETDWGNDPAEVMIH